MRSLLGALLLVAGCSDSHFIVVEVDEIPTNATKLVVSLTRAGEPASALTYDLSGVATGTFAVSLPHTGGWVSAVIAAQDDTGCDLAAAGGGIENGTTSARQDGDVTLSANDDTPCPFSHTPGSLYFPAGAYTIGCTTDTDPDCNATIESPEQPVALKAFEIDYEEVTRGAYADCVEDGACTTGPTIAGLDIEDAQTGVTWDQANAFCSWAGKSLPTEAQWEVAARNGTATNLYPWGAVTPSCTLANYVGPSGAGCVLPDAYQLLPTRFPAGATPRGLFDMAGNAAEWVTDWYAPRTSLSTTEAASGGPSNGSERVLKGGAFFSLAPALRGAFRFSAAPDGSGSTSVAAGVGFRCVHDL